MGQVTQLVAGAFQKGFIVIEQEIQFIDQGLDVSGKLARQPFGLARLDVADGGLDGVQGFQCDPHLHDHRHRKANAQHQEAGEDVGVEIVYIVLDRHFRRGGNHGQ